MGVTLTVLYGERKVHVRLAGIDSPEKDQRFGSSAHRFTEDLVLGKTVTVAEDIDRYGRIVASVVLPDGSNLNHAIVAAGWAWWYRQYAPGDSVVRVLESQARNEARGLWAEAVPIPPWEWRKQSHVRSRSDRRRSEPAKPSALRSPRCRSGTIAAAGLIAGVLAAAPTWRASPSPTDALGIQ